MIRFVDTYLNKVTMYWLTHNVLKAYIAAAVALSFFGLLHYNPLDILINTFVAVQLCWLVNILLAKIFKAQVNNESAYITGLILACIIPVQFPKNIFFLISACIAAMLSKYILTIEKRHIFNPAAVGVTAISLLSNNIATWWIGTSVMIPFVLIGGLLIARKIQRIRMLAIFFLTHFLIVAVSSFFHQGNILAILSTCQKSILDSSLIFFAFIMFTEPSTSPGTKTKRDWYAVFTAILFSTPALRIGFAFAPEMALCIGNVFSYLISPNYRLTLSLAWKKIFDDTGIFAFSLSQPVAFTPGQYMEWTLPHKNIDIRGNRRYFSIGSSPTEKELMIAVKFYNPSSSFKTKLHSLEKGDEIIANQLAGDFVLPKDFKKPLVFIAGGIGIVPFRSMVKYLIDKKLKADIVLLYANRKEEEIAFKEIFEEVKKNGLRTIYILTEKEGYITSETIQRNIKDYATRTFYLSGPQLMVERYHSMLKQMKIPRNQIIQDFFPGYNER